ncbi:hypothetical protein ACQY0O_000158 [Thecaphora frezii]
MTITTLGTAVHITPTIIRTVFTHFASKLNKPKQDRNTEATDELLFDEAFQIVKSFIELATHDTVEALQKFANTHVPAPLSATMLPTMVPMASCFQAAELLKQYFGPQDLTDLVGGDKWWQVRGIAGVHAEWIAQTSDWKKTKAMDKQHPATKTSQPKKPPKRSTRHEKASDGAAKGLTSSTAAASRDRAETASPEDPDRDGDEASKQVPSSEELDRLQRVMLYIHGGGYYFGSMSTHRYQVARFARKFGGRCFAPIYRKAPQYPWPCALQDCLAAYLFLIHPPPGAAHKAIDPKKLVIAGDSAGGGLSLALMTVLRDLDLPMPAGAVLISPWCDMTHSFPSILQNTETDIIPPYSFVHKPSTLWPVPGVAPELAESDDPRRKVPIGVDEEDRSRQTGTATTKGSKLHSIPAARKSHEAVRSQSSKNPREQAVRGSNGRQVYINGVPPPPNLLYSEPIEIETADPQKPNIQLRSQIQLYATNPQLSHPLCSPILHGSLGGLPPLYIIAGNAEVLRDEIIYLAHRAAHPRRYPLRADLLERSERARQSSVRYDDKPTKVHLQVYDDMCHVPTLFAFTTQSRFAYRAVASFVKHVTGAPTNLKDPFPDVAEGDIGPEDASERSGSEVLSGSEMLSPLQPIHSAGESTRLTTPQQSTNNSRQASRKSSQAGLAPMFSSLAPIDTSATEAQSELVASPVDASASQDSPSTRLHGSHAPFTAASKQTTLSAEDASLRSEASIREEKRRASSVGIGNEYTGQVPLTRPSFQSYMIRERVNVKGFLRPLEPESELQALRMDPNEIGRIKEGPCGRYLTGQELWEKKFEKTAKKVEKKRAKNEEAAQRLLERAAELGLLEASPQHASAAGLEEAEGGTWAGLGALGPTELVDETPPPSAIAGRRDTEEALALLCTSLYIRAEQRGVKKSKLDMRRMPEQSHAEKPADGRTRYGLKLWSYLMVRGGKKAAERRKAAAVAAASARKKSE